MASPVNKPKLPKAIKLSPDVAEIAVRTAQLMGLSPRATVEGIVRTCWQLYQTGQYTTQQHEQTSTTDLPTV